MVNMIIMVLQILLYLCVLCVRHEVIHVAVVYAILIITVKEHEVMHRTWQLQVVLFVCTARMQN